MVHPLPPFRWIYVFFEEFQGQGFLWLRPERLITASFEKWAILCLFFVNFLSFSNEQNTIFITNCSEKYPSRAWCKDSNSQPLDPKSSSITTRPGLPPRLICVFFIVLFILLILKLTRFVPGSSTRCTTATDTYLVNPISLHFWLHSVHVQTKSVLEMPRIVNVSNC